MNDVVEQPKIRESPDELIDSIEERLGYFDHETHLRRQEIIQLEIIKQLKRIADCLEDGITVIEGGKEE